MFSILPLDDNFCSEDSLFFTDYESAYDSALDWSEQLHGRCVNVYEHHGGKSIPVAKVFWA